MFAKIKLNLKKRDWEDKMDIDITELTAFEIQRVLSNYPRGRLAVKHDRIFWDSGDFEPVPRPNEAAREFDPRQPPRAPQQGNKVGQAFERMADTLGAMVC